MLDFAIDLRQRFLAAHRENGVTEADEDRNRGESGPDRPSQPPKRIVGEAQIAQGRRRRQLSRTAPQQRQCAPGDHEDHHHRGHHHDPHRILARLVNALGVAPPEIDGDEHRDKRRYCADRQAERAAGPMQQVVQQPDDVLARRDATDRPRQDVVEEQRRDRQLRQRAAHRFLDDPVHAAANEHRRAFDVHGAHRVREQHDAEDEPGRSLSHRLLDDASDVERGRPEIVQDDRGRAPKGDERKEYGGGDDDADAPGAGEFCGDHGASPAARLTSGGPGDPL